jgi:3-oxoacyl-[acyl-carrier protein] reductase
MNTILVTGASRGVGLEILKKLLNNNCKVVGLSRRKTDAIIDLEDQFGNQLKYEEFDLIDVNEIKSFYLQTLKGYGPYNGLVNNAAMAYDDIVTNADEERLLAMYKVNVLSPIMLTKYIIRDKLLNNTDLSLVHISSISAHTGYKGLSMYASSKGALEAFSKNIAREWGEMGVRSNVVCPGFMDTDMSASLSEDQKDRIYRRNSLKKPTSISSVAETVKFLLSPQAESITGETIHVDSGTI